MYTPKDKKVIFTFVSPIAEDKKSCWMASVIFTPGADENAIFDIIVKDGEDNLIPKAIFEFAGCALEVESGAARISYRDFIKGKHEKAIWLHRPGYNATPGLLTFA